jgi:hypothetical protein
MSRPRKLSDEQRKEHARQSQRKWRATESGRKCRYNSRKSYYSRTEYTAVNSYCKWTSEDTETLLNFEGTDYELALKLGRSISAIQLRRFRLVESGVVEKKGGQNND